MNLKSLNIIYDGQCGFCIRALNLINAMDVCSKLSFYDAHQPSTFERFPILRGADVKDAMYTVADNDPQKAHRGFYAFRRLLWSIPFLWVLIPLFYFPGMSFPGTRVYAWVARNRTRFGCGSDFCSLPTGPRAKRTQHEGQSVEL
jgi:predicted DCC family thiol-disulfide oxidoreductase YuxK